MRIAYALIAAVLLVAGVFFLLPSSAEGDNANIEFVEKDDPEMVAAIAEAKRTLPEFLAVLAAPPTGSGDFVVKFPLGGWEHIWVANPVRNGDVIIGQLSNEPEQDGYRMGEQVRVPLAEISDWGWRGADGVMRGHHTTRVLLPRLAPEEAAVARQFMGWQ